MRRPLLLIVALVATSCKENPPPPIVVKPPPPKIEPAYDLRIHHLDLGTHLQSSLFITANVPIKPEDFTLIDDAGREHPARKADPAEFFHRELQREPRGLAVTFTSPAGAALDVRLPGGSKRAVYRRAGEDAFNPPTRSLRCEDWILQVSVRFTPNKVTPDSEIDLEIRATPAVGNPSPLDPTRFLLITDEGDLLQPQVRTTNPFRIHYTNCPRSARRVRIQTGFRGSRLEYIVFPNADFALAAAPAIKPDPPAALPADPVAALRLLATRPSDESRSIALAILSRAIPEETTAGLKAFSENRADLAESRLTRAALLAAPYGPEFSRQLMKLLFLMKQPRKAPTGCAACAGAGSALCGSCKDGLVSGNCPRCETKGSVACLLCEGAGTLDHHGYKGTLAIVLEKPFKFKYQGKDATMPPQTVTYRMSPCAGSGGFQLHAESTTGGAGSSRQSCEKFWEEMRRFVFTGRARILVPNRSGKLVGYGAPAARRLFADYEICKGGRVPCDRCVGKKTTLCPLCSGGGQAKVLCVTCEGAAIRPCPSCKGYGDASWLAGLLPSAPALSKALSDHAAALRAWLDERALAAARREALARSLEEAKKGLDPNARMGPDFIEVACPACKGAGGECGDCWATGRREYFEGSPPYERYALAKRLERRLQQASAGGGGIPSLQAIAAVVGPSKPAIAVSIPGTVDEMLRQADALHASGRGHLEKAKASTQNAVWIEESEKALDDLRQAQTLYASAQETLDARGLPVPKDLLSKFRLNMQALVIARKQAP